MGIISPVLERSAFTSGGYPLVEGYTREDYRKSYAKMVGLVGKLHEAGVPIVAGTDGWGIELIRELEIYQQAGFTPAEALQSATILPARVVGADKRTGSIAVGKEADMVCVDGDPSGARRASPRPRPVSDGYAWTPASFERRQAIAAAEVTASRLGRGLVPRPAALHSSKSRAPPSAPSAVTPPPGWFPIRTCRGRGSARGVAVPRAGRAETLVRLSWP